MLTRPEVESLPSSRIKLQEFPMSGQAGGEAYGAGDVFGLSK